MLKLNLEHAQITLEDMKTYQSKVNSIHEAMNNRTSSGSDFLGWKDLPLNMDYEELGRIKEVAKKIQKECDVLVVIGIGGSYLGARSAIEMINGLYKKDGVEIIYLGNGLSANYLNQVMEYVKDKEFAINVISKSGTTTEPAIAFRLLWELLKTKNNKLEDRVFVTTDKQKGVLVNVANANGYQKFVVPDDVGGRYSVITAVGLLPIAVAGIDVDELIEGLKIAHNDFSNPDLNNNIAYQYAIARQLLRNKGCVSEMYVTYENQFVMFNEWLKQLFGESEGKEGKGLLPTSAGFTTDLHSLGQFIQEGNNSVFFETILNVQSVGNDVVIPKLDDDGDGLNYLSGKTVSYVNQQAYLGTLEAHSKTGNVPCIVLDMDKMNAKTYGYLIYFFMIACAMSCYLIDINPFNQPGVEVYKANMFKLLGKK